MKIGPVTFSYNKQKEPVLKELSLEVIEGKINVIIGLNGVGKSTLLDVISGVHSLKDFSPPFMKKDVVYQLQGIYLPPALKGKDIVRLILKTDMDLSFKKCTEKLVSSLEPIEKEMFDRLWKTKIGDMSVGEKRWLIIRTICELERKIYIFDEPTAGIDPNSRAIIMSALERLAKREDTTVIMSTHILHELQFTECIINFLHKGKIGFHGSYDEFLEVNETENPDIAFQEFLKRAV